MVNKYELTKAWSKLTIVRATQNRVPTNGSKLSNTEFASLALIAHNNGTMTIQKILAHPYFMDTSLSTIKRAIITLLDEQLIVSKTGSDKRENLLSIVEVL